MASSKSSHIPPTGATIHQLKIKPIFDGLEKREKMYAHFLARAAWHGSRIIMRQVSAESPHIFDVIMNLYRACNGEWERLILQCGISPEQLESFLDYAAMFLCNLGNYYGDQKFIPNLTSETLEKIITFSSEASIDVKSLVEEITAVLPFVLGYPSDNAQSGYYPSDIDITQDDIEKVSKAMNAHSIGPENTRIRKIVYDGKPVLQLLQASVETTPSGDGKESLADDVILMCGDHAQELRKVCSALERAKEYAANDQQSRFLAYYIECFRTGNLEAFQESQRAWVTDVSARVENILGFIEPYRDPAGIRAEWEAMVGIADAEESKRLKTFVDMSSKFIRQLPWAIEGVDDGKGPFEKTLFEAPDFTSVHALAVCGSVVFEAANLPNYEYIRENHGFKNIVLANRLSVNNNLSLPCYWVDNSEFAFYKKTTHIVRFLTTAIHELIGHGTGKLLSETAPGSYNFSQEDPPINPLTGKVITSYYLPGQTWGSVFGKLACTVEECRAILMSEYFMDNKDILAIFGYTDDSEITADELLYATYLNIGVDGVQALEHYSSQEKAWGQVHHQAHFSILKHLLLDGDGVIRVTHDSDQQNLTVHVDRSKIRSQGKTSLGHYLCKLHIWRCTADVNACREMYEPL